MKDIRIYLLGLFLLMLPQSINAQFFKKLLKTVGEIVLDDSNSSSNSSYKSQTTESSYNEKKTLKDYGISGQIDGINIQYLSYSTDVPRLRVGVNYHCNISGEEFLNCYVLVDNAPLPEITDYNTLIAAKDKKCRLELNLTDKSQTYIEGEPPFNSKYMSGTSDNTIYLRGYIVHRKTQSIVHSYTASFQKSQLMVIPSKRSYLLGKILDMNVKGLTVYEKETVMNVEMKVWRSYYNTQYKFIAALSLSPIGKAEAYVELPQILSSTCYGYQSKKGIAYSELETVNVEITIPNSLLSSLKGRQYYLKGFVLDETAVRKFRYEMTEDVLAYQFTCKPHDFSAIPVRYGNQANREFFENLTAAISNDLSNGAGGGSTCSRCKGSGTIQGGSGGAVDCPNCGGNGIIYSGIDAFISANKAIQANNARKAAQLFPNVSSNNREGNGTQTFANGDKYTGTFKYGYPHGKGTYVWSNGDKYVGDVRYGQMHGKGTLYSEDHKYTGDFYDDYIDGKGILYMPNGDSWEGSFAKEQPYGKGIFWEKATNKKVEVEF